MVEVRDLKEWYRLPASLQEKCLAVTQFMLDQQEVDSDDVAEVTSIVYDAGASHVSMDVRITPVLETVRIEIEMPQQKAGDVCEGCRHFWEERNIEPRVLQPLGVTEKHERPVPACPHCDGNALGIKTKKA